VRHLAWNRFRRRVRSVLGVLTVFSAVTLVATAAEARRSGIIASDCQGCHSGGGAAIEITASPAMFAPGDDVTFTVSLRRLEGMAGVGGVSITPPPTGQLHTIAGEGLTLVADAGLTHSQPKQASSGIVTFRFGWRAPAEPGGVVLDVNGLAGNGDGRPSGDVAGFARFLATFGCEPSIHYADLDRDGHGTDLFETSIGCAGVAPPVGFSTVADDCNDNDQNVFPLAVEKCNRKDDDCDMEVDEDAELVELWPDPDGDGYYQSKTGTSVIGCSGMVGYAADPGDCAPNDAAINAGVVETCNLRDDNCDGRADERVRPQCGEGRCRRESYDCDAANCEPGAPVLERCNYLDDDCNGEVDDGDICAPGSACLAGKCVVTEGAAGVAGAPAAGGAGTTTTGGTAGESSNAGTGVGGAAASSATGGTPGTGGNGATSAAAGGTLPPTTGESSGCALTARGSSDTFLGVALLGIMAGLLRARRGALRLQTPQRRR
jgi:hypothetical protein